MKAAGGLITGSLYFAGLPEYAGETTRSLSQHRINLRELIRTAATVCDLLFLYPDYAPGEMVEELRRGLKV